MTIYLDIPHLDRFGWMRVEDAVPVRLCERLLEVLEAEMDVPVHDQSRWREHGGKARDLVPIWGHQAQWDIRQHPDLHRIWATLWKTDGLRVWLDSCRFTPPWNPASPSHSEFIGITIPGIPRCTCSRRGGFDRHRRQPGRLPLCPVALSRARSVVASAEARSGRQKLARE